MIYTDETAEQLSDWTAHLATLPNVTIGREFAMAAVPGNETDGDDL